MPFPLVTHLPAAFILASLCLPSSLALRLLFRSSAHPLAVTLSAYCRHLPSPQSASLASVIRRYNDIGDVALLAAAMAPDRDARA